MHKDRTFSINTKIKEEWMLLKLIDNILLKWKSTYNKEYEDFIENMSRKSSLEHLA